MSYLCLLYTSTGSIVVPLIIYGIKSGAGILFYVDTIISFLVLPVRPMIVGSLITMILMRFTNLSKHKDALRVVAVSYTHLDVYKRQVLYYLEA